MKRNKLIQCDGALLAECVFGIMGEEGLYFGGMTGNTVKMVDNPYVATWFYNESSAYELCLELQCWTHKWFGVVEL